MEYPMKNLHIYQIIKLFTIILCILIFEPNLVAQDALSPQDLLQLKSCNEAKVSPDGKWIAYTVRVPRSAIEKSGNAYSELYLLSTQDYNEIPFIT